MPRDLPIGNGSMLVAFDADYRLADFYFPHVGMENHAASRFRLGIWFDDRLQWFEDVEWQKTLSYLRDTLVTDVSCEHEGAGIKLRFHDAVDPDANVFLRKIVVRNTRSEAREIKLFLHHDFNLYGNAIGDTAMYDPETRSVIHYKARRYLLVGSGANTLHHTYVDDVVRGIFTLAASKKAENDHFIVAGPETIPLRRLGAMVAGLLGTKVPPVRVPLTLARGVAACFDFARYQRLAFVDREPPINNEKRAVRPKLSTASRTSTQLAPDTTAILQRADQRVTMSTAPVSGE